MKVFEEFIGLNGRVKAVVWRGLMPIARTCRCCCNFISLCNLVRYHAASRFMLLTSFPITVTFQLLHLFVPRLT